MPRLRAGILDAEDGKAETPPLHGACRRRQYDPTGLRAIAPDYAHLGFFTVLPGGGLQPNSGAPSNRKSTENTTSFESKPICARFGRKETVRLQRPKIGVCSVSVVWSTSLNPFEYKRISGAPSTPARVSDEVMAEGKDLKSNGLLRGRGRRRCNSRLGVGQLLSTFQLGLHDAVFGRQVFVPRQQLLVYRPWSRRLGYTPNP